MSDLSQSEAITRPHPMAGRLAVAPIPASREAANQQGNFAGLFAIEVEVGYLAGIVLEIGEVPERFGNELDYITPYGPGATVFYPEARAVKLKGFHFIGMGDVLAWEAAQ